MLLGVSVSGLPTRPYVIETEDGRAYMVRGDVRGLFEGRLDEEQGEDYVFEELGALMDNGIRHLLSKVDFAKLMILEQLGKLSVEPLGKPKKKIDNEQEKEKLEYEEGMQQHEDQMEEENTMKKC